MTRKINYKCYDCSKLRFRVWHELPASPIPKCFVKSACVRKRHYYRYLEQNRAKQLKYHRYRKFCGDKCSLCGSVRSLEVHHIKPHIRIGKDTQDNTITLCKRCHLVITRFYRAMGWESNKKPLVAGETNYLSHDVKSPIRASVSPATTQVCGIGG